MLWRRVVAVALAPYAAWLIFGYEGHFLDGVNLAFHEAGHLFLLPFGQALHFLGGTLAQLAVPAAAALHFRARGDRFAAAICWLWLGESGMNVAVYMADARAQALPLVGGGVHDWLWLLSKTGLLAHCETLGSLLHLGASGVVAVAWWAAARHAFASDVSGESASRSALGVDGFRSGPVP
jgi:hypothetical protein